jgi:predicted lipoprotein with Yx(FWY)xxD motif
MVLFKRPVKGAAMNPLKRLFMALTLIIAVAAVAGPVQAAGNNIDVKTRDGLGSYLVDSKGMTLYYFKNDSPGKSACAGPCVEKWPLFHIDAAVAPAGVNAKDFGVITRDDGKKQTTYKGLPLYYFAGDKAPGDTNGQGVKDVWYVVKP